MLLLKIKTDSIFIDVDSSTLPFLVEESKELAGWELYERSRPRTAP